jgi:hypothetical protein
MAPLPPVGASLLANAVDQAQHCSLTHRFREQARSYRGFMVIQMAAVEGSSWRCASQISSCSH